VRNKKIKDLKYSKNSEENQQCNYNTATQAQINRMGLKKLIKNSNFYPPQISPVQPN